MQPFSASAWSNRKRIWLSDEAIVCALPDAFYQPLAPSDIDQGDPFVLRVPPEANTEYEFYIYITGEQPNEGRAILCYGSHDLREAHPLGWCLIDETPRAHWAPYVRYLPSLEYPYVMLYSRSVAPGEQAHVGHQIIRAHSKGPEGPFIDSGQVLTPDDDFAIDPDVYTMSNGQTMLAFATDFVDDAPLGTGIVEAPISPDLTRIVGERTVLARAKTDLQVYEEARAMPWKHIPGIRWERGDVVKWYTVEAPVYLTSPHGWRVVLYSTGCYYKENYAVGALVEDEAGSFFDVTAVRGHFVVRAQPESHIYSIGHPSHVRIDGSDFLIIHMRRGSVDEPRQMTVVPLLWTQDGLPFCPSLTELTRAATGGLKSTTGDITAGEGKYDEGIPPRDEARTDCSRSPADLELPDAYQ